MWTWIRWVVAVALLLIGRPLVWAQTTSGTIAGHIGDSQGLVVPGATITVSSPELQGSRTATSSANGDYVITPLPPGTYTVSVERSGFEPQTSTVALAPTQTLALNVTLGPRVERETITVTGNAADILSQTAQAAINFNQDLVNLLPTNRSVPSVVMLAGSVHQTGPGGAMSIAGATSFESLFLINGVTVNENVRGQPLPLVIEDAIQDTTIASSGISAEFGRFSGGLVNVVTKSGGNTFSGSFRTTLHNDDWRTLTPFERETIAADPGHADTRFDRTVPTSEYTFGGPVLKDRLWFFTAGRFQNQAEGRQTVAPLNVPYVAESDTKRFEIKATYSLNSHHTVQGAFAKILEDQVNATFNPATSMDLRSLYTYQQPQRLFTLMYGGVLSPTLFLESRFSSRELRFVGRGAPSTDLTEGTLVLDRARGNLRYWSPTQCGACDPEERDNDEIFVKGSYFLSGGRGGSHLMSMGYDTFNDERFANNHQSGSDFRILGTTTIIDGTSIFPRFLPGTTLLQANPIAAGSNGSDFRTHSLFYNDRWRANSRLTLNLGVRWDRNHGKDSADQLVARDSSWSPRLGLVWDPGADGRWAITSSFGKYVASLNNSLADASSAAGNPATLIWVYTGPPVNPSGTTDPLVTTDVAIQRVFDWFTAAGGMSRPPDASLLPGISVRIPDTIRSPYALEWASGVGREAGRSSVRADIMYRTYHDFYSGRIDQSTGVVADPFGHTSDLAFIENTDIPARRYAALTVTGGVRLAPGTSAGGAYTLSRLWGNFDGENSNSGPLFADVSQYPEYREASWYMPDGDLSSDQRHRVNLWIYYTVPRVNRLTVSLLQQAASGVPYGALGQVDARPYVIGTTYATPQGSATENYYFTARDAFRTAASFRTDIGINYTRGVGAGGRKVDLFGQLQVLNVFDQSRLCGCGVDVFTSGDAFGLSRIGSSVLNATNTPSLQGFNPFTTAPIQGTHWDYGDNFGKPLNRFAYTSPRALRLSFGVRF